jgi:hypothetical protein
VLAPGEYAGAYITKPVKIDGKNKATITSGPKNSYDVDQGLVLVEGSSGTTISHLKFNVDLAIMNDDSVNDVTVKHCKFTDAVQAISNRGGDGWNITHNTITNIRTRRIEVKYLGKTIVGYGGGIGILISDRNGGTASNNVVSFNKITGTLKVADGDPGGYSGNGILLLADFRGSYSGAKDIEQNNVIKNKVNLTSDNPDAVDVAAFALTESENTTGVNVIHDNVIGYNDFSKTVTQIVLSPTSLEDTNKISRNIGKKREKGHHPSKFRIDKKNKKKHNAGDMKKHDDAGKKKHDHDDHKKHKKDKKGKKK